MIPDKPYQWQTKDKVFYVISLLPFLLAFFGAIYLLWTRAWFLGLIFIGLYLLGNLFQAGACTGCPYKGRYCPPIFGVYLGNMLSVWLYPNKAVDIAFIEKQARLAEIIIYIMLFFPVYWLFSYGIVYLLAYGILIFIHLALFMPSQCEKCSYNEVCPGGIMWQKCRGLFIQ